MLVRFLVVIIAFVTVLAVILVPVPEDSKGNPDPPALALNNNELFHGEVALLVFYGGLLLLTPAFAGVFLGRLPTEISTRGAKFSEVAEKADEITQLTQDRIDEHTRKIRTLEAKISLPKKKSSAEQPEQQTASPRPSSR